MSILVQRELARKMQRLVKLLCVCSRLMGNTPKIGPRSKIAKLSFKLINGNRNKRISGTPHFVSLTVRAVKYLNLLTGNKLTINVLLLDSLLQSPYLSL